MAVRKEKIRNAERPRVLAATSTFDLAPQIAKFGGSYQLIYPQKIALHELSEQAIVDVVADIRQE